jgi:hypothetical protein
MGAPAEPTPTTWYDRKLYTTRVSDWTYPCPECKRPIPTTGYLLRNRGPYLTVWYVEYHCARCNDTFRIQTPETEPLVEEIVRAETREG